MLCCRCGFEWWCTGADKSCPNRSRRHKRGGHCPSLCSAGAFGSELGSYGRYLLLFALSTQPLFPFFSFFTLSLFSSHAFLSANKHECLFQNRRVRSMSCQSDQFHVCMESHVVDHCHPQSIVCRALRVSSRSHLSTLRLRPKPNPILREYCSSDSSKNWSRLNPLLILLVNTKLDFSKPPHFAVSIGSFFLFLRYSQTFEIFLFFEVQQRAHF